MFKKITTAAFSPKYLFWTNTGLGLTFLCSGDAIQQTIVHPRMERYFNTDKDAVIQVHPFDWERSRAMIGGGVFFGSVGHFYYKYLDAKFPGKSSSMIKKKLLCEMAAGIPFGFGGFTIVGALERKPFKDNCKAFYENLGVLLAGDWGFYVPLQYFNFFLVPPQYRVLFVSVIMLVYDTFFSYLLHKPLKSKEDINGHRDSTSNSINSSPTDILTKHIEKVI